MCKQTITFYLTANLNTCNYDDQGFKGEGHSKRLTFLSSPIASKYSAFPVTEVSASEVSVIQKKFVSKETTSEASILKLSWQPGRVYVTSFRPTRHWREGEKLCIRHKVSKMYFFETIIHFTIFNAIISEFGACSAQNNPEW